MPPEGTPLRFLGSTGVTEVLTAISALVDSGELAVDVACGCPKLGSRHATC